MKQFLYPIKEYFDFEIENGAYTYNRQVTLPNEEDFAKKIENARTEEEKEEIRRETLKIMSVNFRPIYVGVLNSSINLRYRDKGFKINFAIFDDRQVEDIIDLFSGDNVFKVGLIFKEHTAERPDKTHLYPDSDFILDRLNIKRGPLRVAGFHLWDCVEKLAKRAYERKKDVLVDEYLTELLNSRLSDEDFRLDSFPSYQPRKKGKEMFKFFMKARKKKPWLWQNY